MTLPNADLFGKLVCGIAKTCFKVYIRVKQKPASLLWAIGPILFLVFYICVLIAIFISPLITIWFSFLANLQWSASRIGQLLR